MRKGQIVPRVNAGYDATRGTNSGLRAAEMEQADRYRVRAVFMFGGNKA
jgi:hypothetical protein